MRFRELKAQRELLEAGYLTKDAGVVILPSDAREYLRTFEQLPPKERDAVLPRVLAAALKRFGATGNVQDASQTVHNTCESEHNRLDAELAILRFSVWVAPALGFVGTVRGIGLALQGAELAVKGDTTAVTNGLGISFNSTLVALTLSIFLMYILHEIQLSQERLDARHRELRRGRADQPPARQLTRSRAAIIRHDCGSVLPQLITRSSARFAAIAPVSNHFALEERTMNRRKSLLLVIGSLLATSSFAGPKNRAAKTRETRVAAEGRVDRPRQRRRDRRARGRPRRPRARRRVRRLARRPFPRRAQRSARGRRARRAGERPRRRRSRQLLAASERAVAAKDAELFSERVAHRRDLQEALSVEVFFRTEESGLGGTTEERLAKLAALIEPMDGAVIRLEGYTDARGTETYNSTLSTARAEAVRDALIRGGMPAERVIVTARRRDGLDGSGAGHGRHGARAPRRDERRRRRRGGRVAELGTN